MWPRRYYAGRYFAPRYWPESQGTVPVVILWMGVSFTTGAPEATFTSVFPTVTYRAKGV